MHSNMTPAKSAIGTDVSLRIGDVRIRLRDPERNWQFEAGDSHADFVVRDSESPDIDLTVRRGPAPRQTAGETIASTDGGLWNLIRQGEELVFLFSAPAEAGAIHRVARTDRALTRGEILVTPAGDRAGFHPYPLRYPLDEILVINHLARGRGAILHACAVVTPGGEGWIFLGRSGAGKSTLSNLWRNRTDAVILSDDRVIVRPSAEGFEIYGTPWHGDARVGSPLSAPLRRLFLLSHGGENRAVPVGLEEAVEDLLVNCFAPFYDADGMQWTLEILSRIAGAVPVSRLHFLPAASAVDYLLGLQTR
jgi:hypothetical protein